MKAATERQPTVFEEECARIVEKYLMQNRNKMLPAAKAMGITQATVRKWCKRFRMGPYKAA